MYGCTPVVDEPTTLRNVHLAGVLYEEPGSVAPPDLPVPVVLLTEGVLTDLIPPRRPRGG